MSIRIKAFIYVVAFLILMSFLFYAVQRSIIFPSFIKIEYNETADNIRRVMKSIDREIYHLDKICHDWAQWTDSYDFIDSLSEDYLEDNLLYETFLNNNINLIYYFKNDGTVLWGRTYDFEKEEAVTIDFLNNIQLEPLHPMLSLRPSTEEEKNRLKSGVIDTSHGPMLFVTRPILRSDGSGPSRGMITMGRFINREMIESLKDQTRLDFEIDYPLTIEKIRLIKDEKTTYVEKDLTFYTLAQDQFTDVRTFYDDVYDKPLFSIYYRFPREITRQGLTSMWYALFFFICAGLIVSVALIILLHYKFVQPLQHLTNHALGFEYDEDFSARLNLNRKDEIGTLAKSFDIMMQTIKERTDDLKGANEKLTKLSQIDGLTGIANRRMFNEFIAKEWRRMTREKGCLSLILADVDFFKKYNDIYGHQMGDECLIEVAGVISRSIHRPNDLGARYGGEEFAVILPDTDEKGALFIAEKIRAAIMDRNIAHKGSTANSCVTISLGICTVIPQHGDDFSDFIRNADHALYFAKETGRNRTMIFGQFPEMLPGKK
jgi:diguanylate cyclase (GGDEF)-like protein